MRFRFYSPYVLKENFFNSINWLENQMRKFYIGMLSFLISESDKSFWTVLLNFRKSRDK